MERSGKTGEIFVHQNLIGDRVVVEREVARMIPEFLEQTARQMVVPFTNKTGKPRRGGRIGLGEEHEFSFRPTKFEVLEAHDSKWRCPIGSQVQVWSLESRPWRHDRLVSHQPKNGIWGTKVMRSPEECVFRVKIEFKGY